MHFAYPVILSLILPCLILYWLVRRAVGLNEKQLDSFIASPLLEKLQNPSFAQLSRHAQVATLCLALFLLILTLAQPQWGFTWRERSSSGVDLVIAVDISKSMLATDVSPTRLEQARREIIDLLAHLKGDRVGLVSFSGVAFTESPLTLDYSAFKLFLNSLNPELIPVGGTNIQAALRESIRVLKNATSKARAKAIVLITDGEEFDGSSLEMLAELKELGVRLYVLGIGTVEGAPIPSSRGYKKDKSGTVIISKLRPDNLAQLAADLNGVYIQSEVSDKDTKQLYLGGIRNQLKAKSLEWGSAKRWNEYFQLPLCLAIFCMLYCWTPILRRKRKIDTVIASMLLCLSSALLPNSASAQETENLGQLASRKFGEASFEQAYSLFSKAQELSPKDARFLTGKGSSLYRMGKFDEAAKDFLKAAEISTNTEQKAQQLYNAANSYTQLKKYQEAIELYKKSLELNPEDEEIKNNLSYVEKLVKLQNQEDSSKKDNQQQSKSDKDKQENQDQQSQKEDNQDTQNSKSNSNQSKQDKNSSEQKEKDDQQDSKGKGKDQKSQPKPTNGENNEKKNSAQEDSSKQNTEPKDRKKQEENKQMSNTAGQDKDKRGEKLSSRELMQLKSVEEQRGAQIQFRARKAIEQLKELDQNIPEKDW